MTYADRWYLEVVKKAIATGKAINKMETCVFFAMANSLKINDVVKLTWGELSQMIINPSSVKQYSNFRWHVYSAFAINMVFGNRLSMSRYMDLRYNHCHKVIEDDYEQYGLHNYESKINAICEEADDQPMSNTINHSPIRKYGWETVDPDQQHFFRIRKTDNERFIKAFSDYENFIDEINTKYKKSIFSHVVHMKPDGLVFNCKDPKSANMNILDAESRLLVASLTNRYKFGVDSIPNNLIPPNYEANLLLTL